MLDIMKAIYDMMGKCTYPVLKEETPRQHVEVFFQASVLSPRRNCQASETPRLHVCPPFSLSPTEDGQEQRRRGDHRRVHRLLPKCKLDIPTPFLLLPPRLVHFLFLITLFSICVQDENIMRSMHLFENVL